MNNNIATLVYCCKDCGHIGSYEEFFVDTVYGGEDTYYAEFVVLACPNCDGNKIELMLNWVEKENG